MILGRRACGARSFVEASDPVAAPAAEREDPLVMSASRLMLPLVFALVALGGCSSRTATFPGHSDPEVWQAMVTAAEEPVYEDWFVFDNQVMVDRENARIEVYRILRRDLVRPGSPW
jgi:hypothetical protein